MKSCAVLLFLLVCVGCGSTPAKPSFLLVAAPSTVTLMNGGSAQALTVSAAPSNGFAQTVNVTLTGLPTGVAATPASVSIAPGSLGQFMLSASGAAVSSSVPLTLTGTPAAASKGSSDTTPSTVAATLAVTQALSNATLSASSYSFSGTLVGSTLAEQVVTVTNTGVADITLSPSLTGDQSFTLLPAGSCGASLAAGASCTETVSYGPTGASGTTPQAAMLNLGLGNVPSGTAQTVALTGTSAVLAAGTVSSTNNPMTALYSITLPYPGSVTVNFGADTTYGHQTWTQSTTTNNQTVNILVAGMPEKTTYHLQAAIQLANGITATDADHTFTNGTSEVQSKLTVTTTPGMTPQPGVEQLTFITGSFGLSVTDLQGNTIWSYRLPNDNGGYSIEGAKLLPDGNFLVTIGEGSSYPLTGGAEPANPVIAIRELDLAGNIIKEITAPELTDELQAAGYNLNLLEFHHDVTPLPNGHWLVLSNTLRPFTNLTGYQGTTNVLGDVIIDLDQNLQPVWVWNEFDHLDVNRHPYNFPDWTHTNAIIYSPSDHNIIVSMRHQNWVVKVDYQDGAGAGDILWRLGEGGDFKLVGGTDPTDWQYAQHGPHLFSPNSSGVFSLGLLDNGDDRLFPTGVTCGQGGAPACLYSTVPVFQIDEGAKTATLVFHQILDPSLYSFFGGNAELMDNGNIEYDLAGIGTSQSDIFEVTPTSTPQTVWHLHSGNAYAYRGYRLPSLYPGVQW
jgi:arylsulfate sulfotransferase